MAAEGLSPRRIGLLVLAVVLGLSPLLLGSVLLARSRVAADTAVREIVRRDMELPARVVGGPHLPRGKFLRLEEGRPERWDLLVQRRPQRLDPEGPGPCHRHRLARAGPSPTPVEAGSHRL
jgi:hypothetical protein